MPVNDESLDAKISLAEKKYETKNRELEELRIIITSLRSIQKKYDNVEEQSTKKIVKTQRPLKDRDTGEVMSESIRTEIFNKCVPKLAKYGVTT